MKASTKRVFQVYQVLRAFRYSLLKSVFGVVSHCKHTPTCGTYFIRQIDTNGILRGGSKGLWRVLRCW